MSDLEMRTAAAKFAEDWHERGNEKSDTQSFWLSLLVNVLGVKPNTATAFIQFEKSVERLGRAGYIDAYIPSTKTLIEQKSLGIDLDKAFIQAKEYADYLPLSQKPRWIVVSDFATFRVHDMEKPHAAPEVIELKNLAKESHRLKFLIDTGIDLVKREEEISLAAGRIIGELYDAFLKLYGDNPSEDDLKNLNILCVRIVFCLYAEDAGILPKNAFYNYLNKFISSDIRVAMRDFFETLNTKPENRDRFQDSDLARLPYVNGGLFDGAVSIPPFSTSMRILLLEKASLNFDWSAISPTIFGAVFESTLNPDTRRKGGMHYTSVENIHKVINPLFLDSLRREFQEIVGKNEEPKNRGNDNSASPLRFFDSSIASSISQTTRARLLAFQSKLASLTFLDPACGSGNFLTETYLSLRRLENEVLRILLAGQSELDLGDLVRVNIHQFYGIEINDFAVTVAKTALWIAESQMLKETEDILHRSLDFLPLKTYSNIVEANALTLDWETVVPRDRLSYIIGNPPFVGARFMGVEQKADLVGVFGAKWKNVGNLDFVTAWYKKAVDLMRGTPIRAALVSTNSICQGESVADLWKPLMAQGVTIDFAWRTFRWDSESTNKAHVHCVIVGFSCGEEPKNRGTEANNEETERRRSEEPKRKATNPRGRVASSIASSSSPKTIFSSSGVAHPAANINPYLIDAPDIFVESRSTPLSDVPRIGMGNQPIDDGNYLFTDEEKAAFLAKEPAAAPFFRKWYGSVEFINRKPRWCLWLGDCTPAQLRAMPHCYARVAAVREFRLKTTRASTLKLADRPTRFQTENMPDSDYLLIPKVSSERRRYVPIGFMDKADLASDLVFVIPHATLYHFGVLTSSVHMAWMRAVCGRLEMRYRYSKDVVYNNFPWPELFPADHADCADCRDVARYVSTPVPGGHGLPENSITEKSASSAKSAGDKITATAQAILDARARYPDSSLADLYDELTMPPDLRAAHQANDRAVLSAYGFQSASSAKSAGDKPLPESAIVAELMRRYQSLSAS